MAGTNLATYRADMLAVLEREFKASSGWSWTDPVVFRALTEAGAAIAKRFPAFFENVSLAVSATSAGAGVVRLPAVNGRQIKSIWRTIANGRSLMGFVSAQGLVDLYPLDDVATGEPIYWAWAPTGRNDIWVRPKPDSTYSLQVEAVFSPNPLQRLCSRSGYTASATYNSTAVTLAGDVPEGAIVAGDEFGICPTADQSGTALTDTLPAVWFEISAVTVAASKITGLTLQEAYSAPSVSGVGFVAAQVWDGEALHPGKFGKLPIYLALAGLMEFRDSEGHQTALTLAEREASRISVDGDEPDDVGGWRPGDYLPWVGGAS